MMKIVIQSLVLLAFGSITNPASAFPRIGRPIDFDAVPAGSARAAVAYDFEGIVALSNCSGSIVRFDDSLDTDKAMVLTNGHCVKMITPGTAMANQISLKTFTVLNSKAGRLGTIHATKLLYAAMTGTDLGLYQVKESYQDILESYNVRPFTLEREAPVPGTAINVISGYWKKGYSCEIEAIVPSVQEGNWFFTDSVRYSRPGCEVIGGTSGSPVIASGTRTVVAVNNTVNESGKKCEQNNPCEIDADGVKLSTKGVAYAQETFWLYTCRDEAGLLDLDTPGCLLLNPRGPVASTH